MGTINDYMHEGNGQKQAHLQKEDPSGPKTRRVMICRLHTAGFSGEKKKEPIQQLSLDGPGGGII